MSDPQTPAQPDAPPQINTWWPQLSMRAKHTLDAIAGDLIPDDVRDEVESLTGHRLPPERRLTAEELDFIRTQREMTD